MRFIVILLAGLLLACKPQEQNQVDTEITLTSIADYKLNPDDVILYVTATDIEQTDGGWTCQAEIKRRLGAGAGYTGTVAPGDKIVLRSMQEIPAGDFYCATDYKDSPDGGRYFLKTFLKE